MKSCALYFRFPPHLVFAAAAEVVPEDTSIFARVNARHSSLPTVVPGGRSQQNGEFGAVGDVMMMMEGYTGMVDGAVQLWLLLLLLLLRIRVAGA